MTNKIINEITNESTNRSVEISVCACLGLVNGEKPSQFDLISCDQSKQQGSTLSSLAVKLLFENHNLAQHM